MFCTHALDARAKKCAGGRDLTEFEPALNRGFINMGCMHWSAAHRLQSLPHPTAAFFFLFFFSSFFLFFSFFPVLLSS